MTLVLYVPKKSKWVTLLSTIHLYGTTDESHDKKPDIIHFHNATKEGIDNVHAMNESASSGLEESP